MKWIKILCALFLMISLCGCGADDRSYSGVIEEDGDHQEHEILNEVSEKVEGDIKDGGKSDDVVFNSYIYSGNAMATFQATIPYYKTRVMLRQLSEEELANACELYTAIKNHYSRCYYRFPMTTIQMRQVNWLVQYECPELFHWDYLSSYTYYRDAYSRVTSISLNYTMSSQEYQEKLAEVKKVQKKIHKKIKNDSAYDKELYIYRYIIRNNTYNIPRKNSANIYGTLIEKQSKCAGISKTVKWLLDQEGITNYIIGGNTSGGGHVWNVVKLKKNYYDLDVTWDDLDSSRYKNAYPYGWFNVSMDMARNRVSLYEYYWGLKTPGTVGMSKSYHGRNKSYVKNGKSVANMFYKQMRTRRKHGSGQISFQVENYNDLLKMVKHMQRYINRAGKKCRMNYYITYYYIAHSKTFWGYVRVKKRYR